MESDVPPCLQCEARILPAPRDRFGEYFVKFARLNVRPAIIRFLKYSVKPATAH
jgi:hypothetical protein